VNKAAGYLFTGQEFDQETDLHNFRARMYDSDLGRFYAMDPHAESYPGLSPYAYVGNNPMSFVDPTGRDSVSAQSANTLVVPLAPLVIDLSAFAKFLNPATIIIGLATTMSGDQPTQAEQDATEAQGKTKDEEKPTVAEIPKAENERLQKAIDQLHKPTDTMPGGTAGAIEHEVRTGELVGGKSHIQKGIERLRQLEKIVRQEKLSNADRATAQKAMEALQKALQNVSKGR
jgi:RHS repeat-associated protein